jgi:hypothetical protein
MPCPEFRDFSAERINLFFKLRQSGAARIAIFAAGCSIGQEAWAVVHRIDRDRPGRNADHGRPRLDVLGDDGIGADLGPLAYLDRPQHLRAGANDHARFQSRMPLSADSGRRVRAAQSHILVDGDIITDFGGFPDHREAMVDEKALADPGTRVNVDRRDHARKMVHEARQEI